MSIRHTITLTEPQAEWLRVEAAKFGISVGELVRRIIDQCRDSPSVWEGMSYDERMAELVRMLEEIKCSSP